MVDVPSVPDLVEGGHARVVKRSTKGDATHYRLTPEGQALIYDAMHRRAEYLKVGAMRALDPEGSSDMMQQHEPLPVLRPELADVDQCPAVNAASGMQCTKVTGHPSRHDAGVTFETNAQLHRRMLKAGRSW